MGRPNDGSASKIKGACGQVKEGKKGWGKKGGERKEGNETEKGEKLGIQRSVAELDKMIGNKKTKGRMSSGFITKWFFRLNQSKQEGKCTGQKSARYNCKQR